MRSQKRTYATDRAKNTIVTAIHNTSCIGSLLSWFCYATWRKSEGNTLVIFLRASLLIPRIHCDKLSSPPGWIETHDRNSYTVGAPSDSLHY